MNNYIITKMKSEDFGNLLEISNGIINLKVTLDFGPRIISFNLCGMDNIFHQDKEKKSLGEHFKVYDGDIVKLYGGHRVWISPEVMPACYYPDNNPVTYEEIDKNEITFYAQTEKYTNIKKSLNIIINEDNSVIIQNIIKNNGPFDIKVAAWAITMLKPGGTEIIPITQNKTGLLPNKFFSFWDYTDLKDERLNIGSKYIKFLQDKNKKNPIKIGLNNVDGWASYLIKNQIFIKFFDYKNGEVYPDNGCNFETYTNDFMLEMETLSGLKNLKHNEEIVLTEKWKLFRSDDSFDNKNETEIDAIMKKYI